MPHVIVGTVYVGQAPAEEAVVVLLLDMMGLQPHAGHVDRLAVRWESAVRLVDVGADVPRALDDIGGVIARLVQVLLAELALVDAFEQRLVAVDTGWAELEIG